MDRPVRKANRIEFAPSNGKKVFQIKYFAIYTCAIIEEMPAADDESPISHAQFPLGKFQNHLERERGVFSMDCGNKRYCKTSVLKRQK